MTSELDWRRRWKVDLKASPWKPLEIDGNKYLYKARFTLNSYEILITDMTSMWFETLTENALKKRIQKLNPSIEAALTRIIDQIRDNLEQRNKGTTLTVAFKADGDASEEKILLSINSQLAGMPFSWHFNGRAAGKEMVSEHLSLPLMAMIGELSRRQAELIRIIHTKEKEIDDYKSQGAKTTRKHIETSQFDEPGFLNEMVLAKGFEEQVKALGTTAFNEQGQDLYRQIMTKHSYVTRSPQKGGSGDDFMDDDPSVDGSARPATGASWGNRLPPSLVQQAGQSKSVSPQKSPVKSPTSTSSKSSPETSPVKTKRVRNLTASTNTVGVVRRNNSPLQHVEKEDSELIRRQALERKLANEEMKKTEKVAKKKKKIAF